MLSKDMTQAIAEVAKLLERFDIYQNEWVLVGPNAERAHGYDIDYPRHQHFHILMDTKKIPWDYVQEKYIPELTPPFTSEYGVAYLDFVHKTHFSFDILVSPEPFEKFVQGQIAQVPGESYYYLLPSKDLELSNILFKTFPVEKYSRVVVAMRSLEKSAYTMGDNNIADYARAIADMYEQEFKIESSKEDGRLEKFGQTGVLHGQIGRVGFVTGKVKLILDEDAISQIIPGVIVVVRMASAKIAPLIAQAKGLITDDGGILSHAVVVSREFGIPCIVGTKIATKVFKDGDLVEVDAEKGIVRKI